MVIRVSEIPDEGIRLTDVAGLRDVFGEDGFTLDAVDLAIRREGGEVAVVGRFRAVAPLTCSRCLESIVSTVEPQVDLVLQPCPTARREEVELGRDDLEVDFYRADTLDVAGLLRSETHLALPMKPLCRPDCRGLCPLCGVNRNVSACTCEGRPLDARLAPLEALRRRL